MASTGYNVWEQVFFTLWRTDMPILIKNVAIPNRLESHCSKKRLPLSLSIVRHNCTGSDIFPAQKQRCNRRVAHYYAYIDFYTFFHHTPLHMCWGLAVSALQPKLFYTGKRAAQLNHCQIQASKPRLRYFTTFVGLKQFDTFAAHFTDHHMAKHTQTEWLRQKCTVYFYPKTFSPRPFKSRLNNIVRNIRLTSVEPEPMYFKRRREAVWS